MPAHAHRRLVPLGVLVLLAALLSTLASGAVPGLPVPAGRADGPGVGTPYVVSVGDSYISGEAGRWAGNTNNGESCHDALGSTAYYDNATNTAEQELLRERVTG